VIGDLVLQCHSKKGGSYQVHGDTKMKQNVKRFNNNLAFIQKVTVEEAV
jgi:hypothetical protein